MKAMQIKFSFTVDVFIAGEYERMSRVSVFFLLCNNLSSLVILQGYHSDTGEDRTYSTSQFVCKNEFVNWRPGSVPTSLCIFFFKSQVNNINHFAI